MKLQSTLYHRQTAAGATFLDWGGWQLAAHYGSAASELDRVRNRVGYAEYCFLNTVAVLGSDALETLQRLCTRDIASCPPGRGTYTLVLNDEGAVIDDAIVHRLEQDEFLVTVPSTNPVKFGNPLSFKLPRQPKAWLQSAEGARVSIYERGATILSVQGPYSREMLSEVAAEVRDMNWFDVRELDFGALPVLCSRTGYSGELGFELYTWPEYAVALWDLLADVGRRHEAGPFGVEATLMLGMEKGYLNQVDAFPGSTPLEMGVAWAVDMSKPAFVGRDALLERADKGVEKRLIGLELEDTPAVPKKDDKVMISGEAIGAITNANRSPTLGLNLARAWVDVAFSANDTRVMVAVAGGRQEARVADYRWYDPRNRRVKA